MPDAESSIALTHISRPQRIEEVRRRPLGDFAVESGRGVRRQARRGRVRWTGTLSITSGDRDGSDKVLPAVGIRPGTSLNEALDRSSWNS